MPDLRLRRAFAGTDIFNPSAPAGPTYQTPSYNNAHGKGERLEFDGKFTTSGATMWSIIIAAMASLYNGLTNDAAGYTNDGVPVAGEWFAWDFTNPHLITEIKIYFNTAIADCGVWRIQGYDGAAWVNVGNTFTLGTALTQTIDISSNTTGYTKYRMLGVSGNSSFNLYYWSEIEFKIGAQL